MAAHGDHGHGGGSNVWAYAIIAVAAAAAIIAVFGNPHPERGRGFEPLVGSGQSGGYAQPMRQRAPHDNLPDNWRVVR